MARATNGVESASACRFGLKPEEGCLGWQRLSPYPWHVGYPVSITIDPYDTRWPDLYAQEANCIRKLLGATAPSIDHVGSTAVPGLAAKPRIDIDLVVPDSADEPSYVPALQHGRLLRRNSRTRVA